MNVRQRAPRHDQTAIRGARKGRDGPLDLAGIAHVDRAFTNTIGTVRVAWSNGPTAGGPGGRITPRAGAAKSAEDLRRRPAAPPAPRGVVCTVWAVGPPHCCRAPQK